MTAVDPPALGIVIPTLNEAQNLPALLEDLAQQTLRTEILIVDGGSTDGTPEIARRAGAPCVSAARGRGAQMNAGAAASTCSRLLFLHADTRIHEPGLLARAVAAFEHGAGVHGERIAGHFPLRFLATQAGHERLRRFMEAKTRSNRRWTINGDQGLLIRRGFFERLGGFDASLPFFEDQRIAARIEAAGGHWILLPGEISTSFRRFEREGGIARYTLMALMMGMHAAGLDSFFTRAPQVYAEQGSSTELDLRPFIRLARQVLSEQGLRAPAHLFRAGRFVRENAWQLALMVELASAHPAAVSYFDRRIAPALDHPLVDALTSGLILTTVFGLVPAGLGLFQRPR